jgi:hypothetical protein
MVAARCSMVPRIFLAAAAIFVGASALAAADPTWGLLANRGFERHHIRTALFFAGQAKDGTNPYGCPEAPPRNDFLYTVSPADTRHLKWSESAANREFALDSMLKGGLNVITMSTWGEDFLACEESWGLWAPMQTSPRSQDELFDAAFMKPILIMPFIESRANWAFRDEFPRWTDGRVAPGTVSQIVHLVGRYLKDARHPERAGRWAQVYDSSGLPRYAVSIIHASSNRLAAGDHQKFAEGFDLVAKEVLAATGVRVGFFIDALPPGTNAPGAFRPSAALTGPALLHTASILGVQCFIPEIWMTGMPTQADRIAWKSTFSAGWQDTGIPFLMDVSPGYDAHLVFPGSALYGLDARWLAAMERMVRDYGCDGIAVNSWNGYTEGMAVMPLEAADGGSTYFDWLARLRSTLAGCVKFRRGDSNADGAVDVSDPVAMLGFIFLGSPASLACKKSADADDSGELDISDAVGLLGFLFLGGPGPKKPFPGCDVDPTIDDLDCEVQPGCP